MKFVLTDEELNKYKNDDSLDEKSEYKQFINTVKSDQKNISEKANSKSNSLDKARLETNSAFNIKTSNQQKKVIDDQYPVIAEFQDYDQHANHEKQFYIPFMNDKKMKDQSFKNNKNEYSDQDDYDNQSSQHFDILPLLNESSSSQQRSQQLSQQGSLQLYQQQRSLNSNKGFKLANKTQIGLDFQQQQLSSIKGKNKIILQSKEINQFQNKNLLQDQNNHQNLKAAEKNIFIQNQSKFIQNKKINDNQLIGKDRNQNYSSQPKQLFQNMESFNSNLIPSSLSRNNQQNTSSISNTSQNTTQNQQQKQFQNQSQNGFKQNGLFQSNNQLLQENKLNYLPRYQENILNNRQTNFVSKQHAEKQMMQRIQEKKDLALNMRRKKGFLVTEKYKQKLLRDEQNDSVKKARNGIFFEKYEKLYQQVLLRYYKKDLEDKAIRADGIDFLMFQIPKCIKPKPNILVKKVDDHKLYYGVLQSMRDKHFMDMLEFLQKGNMFTLDQLKRFEEKRLELLNNTLKYNVLFRPKKKKFGTTCFSNQVNRQLLPGQILPNQSFQNNNSLNGGQNSYDFTSESNYMYGEGWSNTNQSSDQYILNVINSLKNQQQNNPFNKSKQPQLDQQPTQQMQIPKQNEQNNQKTNYFKAQKQIQQKQFEDMITSSKVNQQSEAQQNKIIKNQELGTKQQLFVHNVQKTNNYLNSKEQIKDQDNLKNSTQLRTFGGLIVDGINKISQFLRQRIFLIKSKDNQISSSSSSSFYDTNNQN
ncbi:hypothetical protein TTHERM_00444430 (macronuclear) [Tetrahymena thermophila SB210]|uniref:Uncharacterized protein n=1 Tax=Tetrahymena thermophila (strain SB210) TaxID=312017 RepID=I7LWX9_TETTS|nr:hypothetical protein TTHERM_00444430 [Tetrahymena thermophila SB210]EAS03060.3 hypothetical protein TTHERM_00444430 [Tetrahymena thermophila SB210]|eukprot:XP_001023305.3 hypothetical protein TTHERM_00444430 [Tetrahymena thermophila SB210]